MTALHGSVYVPLMPKVARDENLVTYGQAAEILKVSTRTVHRYRATGALRPIIGLDERNAVSVRFRRSDVEALLRGAA